MTDGVESRSDGEKARQKGIADQYHVQSKNEVGPAIDKASDPGRSAASLGSGMTIEGQRTSIVIQEPEKQGDHSYDSAKVKSNSSKRESATRLLHAAARKASSLEQQYGPSTMAMVGKVAASAKSRVHRKATSHTDLSMLDTPASSSATTEGSTRGSSSGVQEKWMIFRTWARWDEVGQKRHIDLRVHGWIYAQRTVDDLKEGLSKTSESDLGFNRKQRLLLTMIKQYSLPKGKKTSRTKDGLSSQQDMPGAFPQTAPEIDSVLTEEPRPLTGTEEAQIANGLKESPSPSLSGGTFSSTNKSESSSDSRTTSLRASLLTPSVLQASARTDAETAKKMHENLLQRMRPFLSRPVVGRGMDVQIEGYIASEDRFRPLKRTTALSGEEGHFTTHLSIPVQESMEAPRIVRIRIRPLNRTRSESDLVSLGNGPSSSSSAAENVEQVPIVAPHGTHTSSEILDIPLMTSGGVRILSDIDDTVRRTFVKAGSKQIIRQLFMNDITMDSAVSGVPEAYRILESEGAQFHYVSNSPWELSASINEFFSVTGLPLGSISLRAYSGMGMLNGFWTNAADRKRQSVLNVLNSFKTSRFILFGDSGEMDLERESCRHMGPRYSR